MNWDMVTAIAAIIGSVAIVVALAFLAQQLKDATRERRLETYHSVLSDVDDVCKLMAHDHANADIWWRASEGVENLTDAERVRYFAMLFILFRSWERVFHFDRGGELEAWSAEAVTRTMVDFAMSNGVQEYWALRKRWYTEDFRQWVDKQMKERSGVDAYGERFRIFGSADERVGAASDSAASDSAERDSAERDSA